MVKMEKLVCAQNMMRFMLRCMAMMLLSLALYSCAGSRKHAATKEMGKSHHAQEQAMRKAIVRHAEQFIGVPYKYGGNSPKEGFDCSGYVKYVFADFNIQVPRVTREYAHFGKRIRLSEVQQGDLILFSLYDDKNTIGHIGIVSRIEGGKIMFLHAASGKNSRKVMESELAGIHLSRMLFIVNVLDK